MNEWWFSNQSIYEKMNCTRCGSAMFLKIVCDYGGFSWRRKCIFCGNLKLLAEIHILIAFNGFRRKLDFNKAKSRYPKKAAHFLSSYRLRQI
jgi:hypothetical protein